MPALLRVLNGLEESDVAEEQKKVYQQELIETYRQLMPVRYAESTIPTFASAMKGHFLPWLDDMNVFIWEVTPNIYDEFSKYMRSNVKAATVINYNTHISNFYDWLISRKKYEIREKYGVIAENPIDAWNTPIRHCDEDDLPPVADKEAVDFYLNKERSEFKKAWQAGDNRTTNILARQLTAENIMLRAGLRIAEVAALNVGDIDLQSMLMIVHKGKGNKDRIVDICPSLGPLLKWYLEQAHPYVLNDKKLTNDVPLFISEQEKRISKKTLQSRLFKQQKDYNVPVDKEFSPHALRRLFATNLYQELIAEGHLDPLTYIKQQLGHVFYSTTLRYCRISEAMVKRSKNKALESIHRNLLGKKD